jgi:hypothetical protein
LYIQEIEVKIMDKAKTRVLVSILKDSALYDSIPHDEKVSLLLRLAEEHPSLFHAEDHANRCYELKQGDHLKRDRQDIRII